MLKYTINNFVVFDCFKSHWVLIKLIIDLKKTDSDQNFLTETFWVGYNNYNNIFIL